jgi:hypothetical protein
MRGRLRSWLCSAVGLLPTGVSRLKDTLRVGRVTRVVARTLIAAKRVVRSTFSRATCSRRRARTGASSCPES